MSDHTRLVSGFLVPVHGKKLASGLLLFGIVVLGAFLGSVTVAPGTVAVVNRSPLLFGAQGVDLVPLTAGRHYLWPTTTIAATIDVRPLQLSEQFADIISSDNVPVTFSAYLILRVREDDAAKLVRDFADTPQAVYQGNIQEQFRTYTRREAEQYGMTSLTTGRADGHDGNVMDEIAGKVQQRLVALIAEQRIPLDIVSVNIGKGTPPREVIDAIARTAAEQQRQKTEAETATAEHARKLAEQERAAADNAYRTAIGLSPDQFVDLEKAKLCAKAPACTLIIGAAGVAVAVPHHGDTSVAKP